MHRFARGWGVQFLPAYSPGRRVRQEVDRQRLPWRLHARHGAGKSENLRPALCAGFAVSALDRIRCDAQVLWHRPGYVVDGEPGALSERRRGKDRNSTEGQSACPGKPTGPAPPGQPASWHRAAHRGSEEARDGIKPNENRHGGFDLGLPVCPIAEFDLAHAGSEREIDGCGAAMLTVGPRTENLATGASDDTSARCNEILRLRLRIVFVG